MKECRLCKTANDDSVAFCRVCGTKFPDPVVQPEEGRIKEDNVKPHIDIVDELKEIQSLLKRKKYEYMAVDKWSLREKIEAAHKDEISGEYNKQSEDNKVYLRYAIQYLNVLGDDGWELIIQDDTFRHCYLLKRERKEE